MSSTDEGKLRVRSDLLAQIRTRQSVAEEAPSASGDSLVIDFVRHCPPLSDPSWAMEECMHLCPRPAVWGDTTLPPQVWSAPGTQECPFHTQLPDFAAASSSAPQ